VDVVEETWTEGPFLGAVLDFEPKVGRDPFCAVSVVQLAEAEVVMTGGWPSTCHPLEELSRVRRQPQE